MSLSVGVEAPDFELHQGIRFQDWRAGRRTLVVALKALSPTCTTECQVLWRLRDALAERELALLAVSGDTPADLAQWEADLQALFGHGLPGTLLVDDDGSLRTALDIAAPGEPGGLQRALLLVGPDGGIEFASAGPVTAGRNFHEILRLVDSIRLTRRDRVATPADWQPGDAVLLAPSLPQNEAERRYGAALQTMRPYLRSIPGR